MRSRPKQSGEVPPPPSLAGLVLSRLLPSHTVNDVLGDLEEVYRVRATSLGVGPARRWYWRQTFRFAVRLVVTRVADLGAVLSRPRTPQRTQQRLRVRRESPMSALKYDIRYATRTVLKNPGFAFVVISILAVGIGANVAMFSVTDAVLLRSLPYRDADHLVLARTTYGDGLAWNVSSPDYYDYRDQNQSLESLAAVRSFASPVTVTGGEEPERVQGTLVSVNFFPTLGIQPQLGRQFTAEEAELTAPDVVIISHGYWQRRFGGSPDALGSTLVVNSLPTTVVGVMPPGFYFRHDVDIWAPMRDGGPYTGVRRFHNWTLVGRLTAGVTLERAQTDIDVISAQLQAAYPDSNRDKGLRLFGLHEALTQGYRDMLYMLMGAIGLVLLIACGNVASLLLARGSGRTAELSVRSALGASGRRLAQQLLTESILIAVAAGILGTVLAVWFQRILIAFMPLDNLGIREIGISAPLLLFALLLALTTALVFGVVPAVVGSRANPAENLKGGTRTSATGGRTKLRSSLVILQVALSLVLLIGAGLLIRSFARLRAVDPGFAEERMLTAEVALPASKYQEPQSRILFFTGLLEDVRAIPGVLAVGAINMLPIRDSYSNVRAWDPENPPPEGTRPQLAEQRAALPGYFEAMEIPVLAGRDFSDTDGQGDPFVLVISETMARGLFPDVNPIGHQVAVDVGGDEPAIADVIGVAGDVRTYSLDSEPPRQMYYSYRQATYSGLRLAIRTQGDPAAVTNAVRRVLRARDSDIPLAGVATMEEVIDGSIGSTRVIMLTLALFGAVAVFLAAIGLYSVLAYYVTQRSREIGIRIAMGASGKRILELVLRRGLALVAGGIVVGVAGAFGATRLIQQQLFNVEPTDPATFIAVSALFLLIAILACLVPALRAVRTDPVKTLQTE
jgi:putative ABC transport system permease protein